MNSWFFTFWFAFDKSSFTTPLYLWLLVGPAALFVLWLWQVIVRRRDIGRLRRGQLQPRMARFGLFGDLGFWLCLLVAASLCIVALAGPRAHIATISFIDWNDPGSARIAPIHMTSSRSKRTRWIGSWSAGGRSAMRIRFSVPSASARSMSAARSATVDSASDRPPR
jgi:hypothetical protein